MLFEVRIEDRFSFFHEFFALFFVDVALNHLFGTGRFYEREPRDRRFALFVGNDFDPVAVLQFVVERHDPFVRFGEGQMVSEV